MKRTLGTAFVVIVITGCSGGSGGESSGQDQAKSTQAAHAKAIPTEVDEAELRSKTFTLKTNLDFFGADVENYTMFEGTPREYKAIAYYYAFQNRRRLNKSEIALADSYCSVYVETSESAPPRRHVFESHGKLLEGQLMTSKSNEYASFELQLQGAAFQSFFLRCKNVGNSAGVTEHIGHWLDVQ